MEIKGLLTKSFGRLGVHVNAAYEFLNGSDAGVRSVTVDSRRTRSRSDEERDGRYAVAVGASYPVGAPRATRTTVLADLFTEQGSRRGEANRVGIELGFRHQLTYRIVVDAGVGTEIDGPADRSAFFATAGVSVGF